MGSPRKDWSVGWRATSAGLWEHGLDALRQRAYAAFETAGMVPKDRADHIRVSRFDYAFDLYCPAFTAEVSADTINHFVAPSEVKWRTDAIGRGHDGERAKVQTLTFGSKSGCQVQIYDKTAEITEMSGKTWMVDLWRIHGGYYPPDDQLRDVWRVEVRCAGDWLKKRTKKRPEAILDGLWGLVADALYNRRLVVPNGRDTNRRRWAAHPLYSVVLEELGDPRTFLPIGHHVSARPDALKDTMIANAAGTIRSLLVLENRGEFKEEELEGMVDRIVRRLLQDREHSSKVERAKQRYAFIDEAL